MIHYLCYFNNVVLTDPLLWYGPIDNQLSTNLKNVYGKEVILILYMKHVLFSEWERSIALNWIRHLNFILIIGKLLLSLQIVWIDPTTKK